MAPMTNPTGAASTATSSTMTSVIRAPNTTRLQMSRPSSSVPIQFSAPGGISRIDRFWPVAECVAIHGANSAMTISTSTIAAPTTASGFPSSARSTR